MKNFLIGTVLIVGTALVAMVLPHFGIKGAEILIVIIPILIIGALFQAVAFIKAKVDMDELDFKHRVTMAEFRAMEAAHNYQKNQEDNESFEEREEDEDSEK